MIAIAAYYPRFIKDPGGLLFYPAAAECMLRGETPLHCKTAYFAYPPVSALLFTPLLALPAWLRDLVWYLILVGALIGSLHVCEALVRRLFPGEWTEGELTLYRGLIFILSLKFMLAVLENQSFDSISLVFILLGLFALVGGRSVMAGASLAVAAALKVTPLIFLPYLLLKRRFVAAGVFAGSVVFLTVLPDLLLPPKESWHSAIWLREVLLGPFFDGPNVTFRFWEESSPLNQSFRGALSRILDENSRPEMFVLGTRLVSGLYLLGVGLSLLRSMRDDRPIAAEGAMLIISGLLLSPVTSQSHFVGLMLAYAVLAAALVQYRPINVSTTVALSASFMLATATSNDLVGRAFTGWALWNNLPMWGALVLAVQLGVLIWSIATRDAGARSERVSARQTDGSARTAD